MNAVGGSLGTILVAAAALIAAWLGWRQWLTNRKDEQKKREEEQKQRREDQLSEQEKRAEERFQKVVEGIEVTMKGAKVVRLFSCEPSCVQATSNFIPRPLILPLPICVFRGLLTASEDPDGVPYLPTDPNLPCHLRHSARRSLWRSRKHFHLLATVLQEREKKALQSLDATNIQLDHAYLQWG